MQWYNEETNECQSNDPGEGCFGELLIERRKGWEQKDDGFRPPAPVPTIQDKTAEINARYQLKLDTYKDNIATAQAIGGATMSTKIANFQAKYNAQLVLKNIELEELYNV